MEKISLILLTAFVFLSAGCSTSAPMKKEEENKADLRNYEKEIDQLLNSANSSQIENPDIIKLRAANIASKAKDYETVGRILTIIKDPSKNDGIRLNYSILKAEKALYDREPAKAITILKGLSEIEGITNKGGKITITKLKAKAYELIGSHIASARELISINSWLPNQFINFMLLNQLLPFLNGFEFFAIKKPVLICLSTFGLRFSLYPIQSCCLQILKSTFSSIFFS